MPKTPALRIYPDCVIKLFEHCDSSLPHTAYLMGVSTTTVRDAISKKKVTKTIENKAKVALHRIRMKQAAPAKAEVPTAKSVEAGCNRVVLMSIPESKLPAVNKVMKILEVPMEELT